MPEDTTITAVMGEQVRAIDAAKCIGSRNSTGAMPLALATAGVRAAKAKNGALPEPITIEDTAMIATMTTIIIMGEKPAPWLPLIRVLMTPMLIKPWANTWPATIRVTTLAICMPMPSKKACTPSKTVFRLRVRINSAIMPTDRPIIIALMILTLIQVIHRGLKLKIKARGTIGSNA